MHFFKVIINLLIDTLFPPRCPVCDQILHYGEKGIHTNCQPLLHYTGQRTCLHCGRPLINRDEYCYDCQKKSKNNSFIFSQGKAIFKYEGKIKKTMYRFKYSNKREYAEFFAQQALTLYYPWIARNQIQAIIPVPMYKKKQKRRGYNQAQVFAEALGRLSNLPVLSYSVYRSKDTTPMKELNDIQRKNNLKNAFQSSTNIVQYSYILLVDDIYTTGSTADAVSEIILSMGVEKVFFLSICIADL